MQQVPDAVSILDPLEVVQGLQESTVNTLRMADFLAGKVV